MITITADFSLDDFEKDLENELKQLFDDLANKLFENAKASIDTQIAKAKTVAGEGGGFGNITYDLRSSMGCGKVRNGQLVETYFPFAKGKGKASGLVLMNERVSEVDGEYGIVLVAGEYYAAFVEMKGYDVTSMSYYTFEQEFFNRLK